MERRPHGHTYRRSRPYRPPLFRAVRFSGATDATDAAVPKAPDPALMVGRASPSTSSLQATINQFLRNPTARPSALSCAAFWPSCSRLLFCFGILWAIVAIVLAGQAVKRAGRGR